MDKLQTESSTGTKIVTVADDPQAYSLLLRYKDAKVRTDGFINNIKNARNELELYENLVNQISEFVREVKILTINAANDAFYIDSKDSLRKSIENLMEKIVNLANNNLKGEYMFSGSKTMTKPFEVVRGSEGIESVTYVGDNREKVFNPDSSERIIINLSGEELFLGPAGQDENIFDALIQFKNDLTDQRLENAEEHISKFDKILNRFINKQGEIGSNVEHINRLESFLGNYSFILDEKSSQIENADLAETISKLLNQETVYKAALEVAARMNKLSILDYI